jgi:hypothetical protein
VIGKYALDGGLNSFQLMTTTKLNIWGTEPKKSSPDGVEVSVPAPKLGFVYDLATQRSGVFIDMRVSASAPSRKSAMNLGVKVGFDVSKLGQPRFTAHVDASEG